MRCTAFSRAIEVPYFHRRVAAELITSHVPQFRRCDERRDAERGSGRARTGREMTGRNRGEFARTAQVATIKTVTTLPGATLEE
jgi:hypothetical protein